MDKAKIYLQVRSKEFKELESKALKRYKEDSGENDENFLFPEGFLHNFELEGDKENISLNGELFSDGKEIAYMNISFPITQELAGLVLDWYSKRLNKMRAVLEAIE